MMLQGFSFLRGWADEMLHMAGNEQDGHMQSSRARIQEKQAEIATIKESLNRLLSIYMTKDIDRETFLSQKEALLTRKKSLQDSIEQQEKEMSRSWLEPFKEWIKTSKTLDEIAQKGSPSEKKSVASKVIRLEPVP